VNATTITDDERASDCARMRRACFYANLIIYRFLICINRFANGSDPMAFTAVADAAAAQFAYF
jgi:hypothetical protein